MKETQKLHYDVFSNSNVNFPPRPWNIADTSAFNFKNRQFHYKTFLICHREKCHIPYLEFIFLNFSKPNSLLLSNFEIWMEKISISPKTWSRGEINRIERSPKYHLISSFSSQLCIALLIRIIYFFIYRSDRKFQLGNILGNDSSLAINLDSNFNTTISKTNLVLLVFYVKSVPSPLVSFRSIRKRILFS